MNRACDRFEATFEMGVERTLEPVVGDAATNTAVTRILEEALVRFRNRLDDVAANVPYAALLSSAYLKSGRVVDPINAFMIDDKTFATKHDRQPAIAETSPLHCYIFESFEGNRVIETRRRILRNRSGTTSNTTRCALTQSKLLQGPHRFLSLRGLQEFFSISCLIASSSSAKFEMMRRIHEFSSSITRDRASSLASMSPNFAFHAATVFG